MTNIESCTATIGILIQSVEIKKFESTIRSIGGILHNVERGYSNAVVYATLTGDQFKDLIALVEQPILGILRDTVNYVNSSKAPLDIIPCDLWRFKELIKWTHR